MSETYEQDSLFAPAPGIVGHAHPETSHIAASEVEPRTGTQRRRVLDYLREVGEFGATDSEIQAALRMDGNTERPRRIELVAAGRVVDSQKRRVVDGRPAIVWEVKTND